MKKVFYAAMIMFAIAFTGQTTQAQAWDKSTKLLGVGIGGSSFFILTIVMARQCKLPVS